MFLPVKKGARIRKLEELAKDNRTKILYESPHRLLKALNDMFEVLGDKEIVCAREITKKFEEIRREKLSSLIAHFSANEPRGEFILII